MIFETAKVPFIEATQLVIERGPTDTEVLDSCGRVFLADRPVEDDPFEPPLGLIGQTEEVSLLAPPLLLG